ncbi:MAG: agglutinin biogenesis protein [Gammaproteobacteria bacterium]
MKQAWQRYSEKFDALSVRERMMVFVAAIAVVCFVGYEAVLSGNLARGSRLSAQIALHEAEAIQTRTRIQALTIALAQDPNQELRAQIAALRSRVEQHDAEVRGVYKGLVTPDRMAAVLEDMLTRSRRVQLLALRTLPVETLVERSADQAEGDAAPALASSGRQVFKHGVRITLEGGYLDLLDYSARLEKLPWQMFWAHAGMDASDYPRVRMTITLYTLSLDKAWLVV